MLVRMKLKDSTTSSDLVASLRTIINGTLTTSGNNPTNLTGISDSNSLVYGSVFADSNSLYSFDSANGFIVTKINSENSSYTSAFKLQAASNNLKITEIGASADSLAACNNEASWIKNQSANYLDVIINDKILAIHQVVGAKLGIIADLKATSLVTNALPDTVLQFYEYTTVSDLNHDAGELTSVYDDDIEDYAKLNDVKINSTTSDHIQKIDTTIVPLAAATVGTQIGGAYPVLGIKGISSTPLFAPAGILDDSDGNYYYTTGKRGFFGGETAENLYTEAGVGSLIVIEVQ